MIVAQRDAESRDELFKITVDVRNVQWMRQGRGISTEILAEAAADSRHCTSTRLLVGFSIMIMIAETWMIVMYKQVEDSQAVDTAQIPGKSQFCKRSWRVQRASG